MKNNKSKSLKELFSMKKKKVLIIGGAGYLGKAMTLSLNELGASVIV
jgi:nucleoside-diphosphate-sugar epimerase